MSKSKILSTRDVAQKYGVDSRDVLYAVNHGKLTARKLGWAWVFREDELPQVFPVKKRTKK